MQQEVKLWEGHWLRSAKELDQWEVILDYGSGNGGGPGGPTGVGGGDSANAMLVLESAWKQTPNWVMMRDALTQVSSLPISSNKNDNFYIYLEACFFKIGSDVKKACPIM